MAKAKKVRIAAVQLNISKPIDSVINDIRKFMHLASTKKVNIICFPEDSISLGPKKNRLILSQVMEGCKLYGIWCIISTYLKEKKYNYNSALLIDDKGNIFGKHKKVHVLGDGPGISPGSKFDVHWYCNMLGRFQSGCNKKDGKKGGKNYLLSYVLVL